MGRQRENATRRSGTGAPRTRQSVTWPLSPNPASHSGLPLHCGRDTLTGGSGADRFVWRDVSEGNASANFADIITDFSRAEGDTISLANIDAIVGGGTANDDFTFIGKSGFSGTAGELRYKFSGGDTMVQIDVDSDATVDMSIRLTGQIELAASDFLGVALPAPASARNPGLLLAPPIEDLTSGPLSL